MRLFEHKDGSQPDSFCSKCGKRFSAGPRDIMQPINNFWERVEPGCIMPSGQCSECGALCYYDEKTLLPLFTKVFIVVHDKRIRQIFTNDLCIDLVIIDLDIAEEDEEFTFKCEQVREAQQLAPYWEDASDEEKVETITSWKLRGKK